MVSRASINCRDLRVQRTYKMLKDTFLRLLTEKPFEKISVQEICDVAMVRRTTFYQHFEDKQDFLQWFVREKQQDFFRKNMPENYQATTREHYMLMAHKVLTYLNENEQMLRLLLSAGVQDRMLVDAFSQAFAEDAKKRIEAMPHAREQLDGIPPMLAAEYYVGGMINVARWWFTSNKPCTEDELVQYLCRLVEEKKTV